MDVTAQIQGNLIGTISNQWNDMTEPKKEEKEMGISSLQCFFLWALLLSFKFYDNKAFTHSCQNFLVIV